MSTQFILGDPSAILPFLNGESAYTPTPSPGSSRFQHFHISHNAPYLLPPPPPHPLQKKVCISIVYSFSWDGCNTQEKWKTKVMQIFGGVGGGGRIRCVMGNVEVAYYHWAVPQAAHAIIGDLSMYTTILVPKPVVSWSPLVGYKLSRVALGTRMVHHANIVVFFRWKSWSCMCFDSRNNLRLWSSPNNKAVGFMDETFGFVEETVAFWDISIVLQNFAL